MARYRLASMLMVGALVSFVPMAHAQRYIDWSRSYLYSSGTSGATASANVTLVGHANGVADTTHRLIVHLRDSNNQPLNGVRVQYINGSGPTRKLCQSQSSSTFDGCALGVGSASVYTDANGEVELAVEGCSDGSESGQSDGTGPGTNHEEGLIQFYDGLAPIDAIGVPVAVLDLDNSGGLGAGDLSLFYQDMWDFGTHSRYRCDYDFNGTVGAADLSFLLGALFHGGSYLSCSSSTCP